MKIWLYPDWPKNETVYAMGAGGTKGMNIRKPPDISLTKTSLSSTHITAWRQAKNHRL